ncbi:MAG TPA: Ada metal-binding domain-containing protein [Methanosarcina sp.]|nr:Ada metal-binding domain-containing protein [Methanosarcina sp.]
MVEYKQKKTAVLKSIVRYVIGVLFLLVGVSSLFSGDILPAVFSFLIGVILTPAIADPIESKIQMSLSAPLRVIAVFCLLIAMGATADPVEPTENIISDPIVSETLIVNNSTVESVAPETPEVKADTPKMIADSPEPEVTPEPEEKITKLEDAKQEAEETAEPEETPGLEETSVSGETQISGSTMQLSEAKKNELIGIVKEYSGSDEIEVMYISPKDSSSTGLVSVTYYLDFPPSKEKLESDLAAILILSQSIAKESGITNDPSVNAVAMLRDGTGLGTGNYYSSTGKTDIVVTISDSKTATTSDTTNTNSEANYENSKSKSTATSNTINTDSKLIYASSKSDKYHSAGCGSVKIIKPENLITFTSRKEAEKAGYEACKKCGG